MNILSLYDGMACGHIAFMLEGVPIDRYVAYEIDGYAVKTAVHNFPDIEQRGDVFDGDFTEFEGFDWLIGGSPCTHWSIAQKNNRETEASGLGWELLCQYTRALKEAKPKFFIYENNKSMSKAIRESITETFGFEPVCINSALVSAQNRQRLYWVGRRNEDGTYSKVDVPQPEDRGILLKDILEGGELVTKDKAYCLKHQAGNARDYFKKHHTDVKFEAVCPMGRDKSRTLTSSYVACSQRDRCIVYEVKDGKITIKGKEYPIKLVDGYYIIRKLTVRECMRLQTVPEWYEFPVSDTQAYKMLGNGWTVEVIRHLIRCAVKDGGKND